MSTKSIALFVSHLGCPCQCSFCNQNAISGQQKMPSEEEIKTAVKTAVLSSEPNQLELAFFGGSFTMIDRKLMLDYLELATELVNEYGLNGIRFSTRPDGIDEEMMQLLSAYPITTIEIGAQSVEDKVLSACRRGHTAEDIILASKLIKKYRIRLVLQMMVGLPESSFAGEMKTAETFVQSGADGVRIYPLLVLKNTPLAQENYGTISLEEAVNRCAELMCYFRKNGVEIVKVGLNAETGFEDSELLSGPYHPAFRELCEGKIYLDEILRQYGGGRVKVYCHSQDLSQVRGHKNRNVQYLQNRFPGCFEFVADANLPKGTVQVKKGG